MELQIQNLDREPLEARSPAELIELVLQLVARMQELEAQLNQPRKTSRNSSKPPSQERGVGSGAGSVGGIGSVTGEKSRSEPSLGRALAARLRRESSVSSGSRFLGRPS